MSMDDFGDMCFQTIIELNPQETPNKTEKNIKISFFEQVKTKI